MNPILTPDAVSHSIQPAVAPVAMPTAVAALIGSLATRRARIIDRARTPEEKPDQPVLKHEGQIRHRLE